ncbi:FAD-dependent oxidoreductase [Pandoraea bronchicola]|uniref:Monooxygenase, FAD-binding protein n=1 Tax=Pandoraea bronchicola TaxID=2508287 RepID=A0A5E5BRX1_9BURK|nr:NAD(P)/FAD-dependent oxidoreductase [Pandoraea bronchicola]VVE88158.1 monooxygenase, FAD-binding protein [Pandoraea bronchicola]
MTEVPLPAACGRLIEIMSALHVTIIGAGLGGLCLAQGLRRAGIPFDVYERDDSPAARFQGYRLRIDADGLDALTQCLPEGQIERVRQRAAVARTGGRFVTPQLDDADVVLPPSWHDAHTDAAIARHRRHPPSTAARRTAPPDGIPGDLSLHRQTLREILLDGILDRVHFGKSFSRTTTTKDGRRIAHFEDGSCSAPGLVVAADGSHSRVREYVLPGMAPRDTGNVCCYGLTPLSTALLVLMDRHGEATMMEGSTVVFANGFAVVIEAMLFRRQPGNEVPSSTPVAPDRMPLSPVSDYLYWAFIGPSQTLLGPAHANGEQPDPAPLARIEALTDGWHPHLHSLFAHAAPDTIRTMPVRSTTSPLPWQVDGVTGLGDAVHTMSPAGGLGANTALRDAAQLAEHLHAVAQGHRPLAQTIAAYEREMCERAREAVRLADAGAALLNARRAPPHAPARPAADAVRL